MSATTPLVTSTPAPIAAVASPCIQLSEKMKAEPAVFTSYAPTSRVAAVVAVPAVSFPKC